MPTLSLQVKTGSSSWIAGALLVLIVPVAAVAIYIASLSDAPAAATCSGLILLNAATGLAKIGDGLSSRSRKRWYVSKSWVNASG